MIDLRERLLSEVLRVVPDAIRNGQMAGAITQDPIGIGERTVESAVAAAKGEKLEEFYDTGSYWYDKTNIDDPKIAAVLYE